MVGVTWSDRAADFAGRLALPALVLSIAMVPTFFLQARGALLETLPTDFSRAARARGLSATRVLFKHGLRAALVPVLTYAGSSVGRLLNGAFLVEVVTGWPGIGRLAWGALLTRDSFLVLGILMLAASLMLAGNLAADLAVAAADPRIRLEES
jgi:peptide/nickel transport system permease protein